MKLLGITKSKITINEKGKNVPNMEITEVVVIQQIVILSIIIIKKKSRVLYTFVPNKSFGQLLDIFKNFRLRIFIY